MSFRLLPNVIDIHIQIFDTVWSHQIHRSRNHEILHVLSGKFELAYADGRRFPATEGDTLIAPVALDHRDIFAFKNDLKIMFIQFAWEHFEEFSQVVSNREINRLSSEARTEVRWIFDRLCEDCAGVSGKELTAARLMNILMLIHHDLTGAEEPARDKDGRQELISAARRYIERNFTSPLRLEEIAGQLRISPFYLSRLFSQESDFSLFEYLAEVRINEARRLLRDSRMLVSEIAARVGFNNASYFAKVFRRRVGCSPVEYREKQ